MNQSCHPLQSTLLSGFLAVISWGGTFTAGDITAYSHRIDKRHRHYYARQFSCKPDEFTSLSTINRPENHARF